MDRSSVGGAADAGESEGIVDNRAHAEHGAQEGRVQPGTRFRPDIEGLRAIAVGLVLLYHGFGEPFTGGYVGVDVFFVISGFLITSLLLNEERQAGHVSLARFYARRVRRILPASTLVVLATVFATYLWLGFVAGNTVAEDAKWTAVFAANIHFGLVGTDYLGSRLPPSPLQHMWSLGVEEQFYLVWPVLFLLLHLLVKGTRRRHALTGVLFLVIGSSFAWSVVQTSDNQTWAYFSPLTRAWELGLGALLAVLAPAIARVRPGWVSEAVAVCGFAGIAVSALVLTESTPFPGSAVALPVVSSGLLIAAGCANPRTIVGRALSVKPMQWVGARSYSLYLWHWPLLIIPAQYVGRDPSVGESAGWLAVAVLASTLSYRCVENPVRRSPSLASRAGLALLVGVSLILVTIAVAQWQIFTHYGPWNPFTTGVM